MKNKQEKKVAKTIIRICSVLAAWIAGNLFFAVPFGWGVVLCAWLNKCLPAWLMVLTMCMAGILGILVGIGMGRIVKELVEDDLYYLCDEVNHQIYEEAKKEARERMSQLRDATMESNKSQNI